MVRRAFWFCVVAMTILGGVVRLHNAMNFPVISGNDAFAHFTYIWFLADTGRIPLADAGWEFFQPPLYYAFMASIWNGLAGLDPQMRLRIGTAVLALLGLLQAGVALAIVRRQFPREPVIQILAVALMLFLPVHLYSAGFVGNEVLNAVVGSISLLLLLRVLDRPTTARAAALGVCLGLGMLTKYTAIVMVAGAAATIGMKAVVRRDLRGGAKTLVTVLAVTVAVSGWYYARNISIYGTPFRLSREQIFLRRVENSQLQGRREFLEYVLFDPGILYRPQWPRGLGLNSPRPPGAPYSAVRESIPTGIYANTWFDGFGGVSLPPVTASEASRRAGQLLLTLAVVPTGLMLFGVVVALRRLLRGRWDDTIVAVLATLTAMTAVLVHGTRSVPTQAAVKATYFMPVSVGFAFLFALGLHELVRRWPRLRTLVAASCAALCLTGALVFTYGLVIDDEWMRTGERGPFATNLYGVIDYAGGRVRRAESWFTASARGGWHLGYENLAALALERGEAASAEWLLMNAVVRQPGQSRGIPADRREAIATTQAEYANSLAVIRHQLGRDEDAMLAAERAIRFDPAVAEASYNLGVLRLLAAGREQDASARRQRLHAAERAFASAVAADAQFREAEGLRGVALALLGDCDAARTHLASGLAENFAELRAYPVETGPGDINAAGLHRRRKIEGLPRELSAESMLRRCLGSASVPAAGKPGNSAAGG